MSKLILFIWIIAIISIFLFLKNYLIPRIKIKITFWLLSRRIKKMAQKYDGKLKQDLLYVANELNKIDIDDEE